MQRLAVEGVSKAVNAFAVSENGKTAYFHDPQADIFVAVNLQNGSRRILKWEDRDYHHHRWLCYTLFSLKHQHEDYLSMLLYNRKKKAFCLTHFLIAGELLIKRQTTVLNTQTILLDRLAYCVQKCSNEIQMIFYERFSSAHADLDEGIQMKYVCCILNCNTMRVASHSGLLPQGQWELPFVSNGSMHVVCSFRTPNLLATRKLDGTDTNWEARAITPSQTTQSAPSRKAMWCNAWSRDGGFFSVTEKIESENDEPTIRRSSVWNLNPVNATWTKLPITFDFPETATNFAFRISTDGNGFVHADLKDREAGIFKIELTEAMGEAQRAAEATDEENWISDEQLQMTSESTVEPSTSREPLADLICPICLDTYDDARTLHCGHSMCWACIEQMRMSVKSETVSCPNCRKPTKIPSGGLPVNYGLKDAITTLNRLIELKNSTIRCAKCHERSEEKKMWTCLTCLRDCTNGQMKHRESMMFVGNVDSFDENTNVGNEGVNNTDTKIDDNPDYLSSSFCGPCLLYHHKRHEHEELLTLRERTKVAKQQKEAWCTAASTAVQQIQKNVEEVTSRVLKTILETNIHSKFLEICDPVRNSSEEIEGRGTAVLNKLDNIRTEFLADFEKSVMEMLLKCSTSDPPSPVTEDLPVKEHAEAEKKSSQSSSISRPVAILADYPLDKEEEIMSETKNEIRKEFSENSFTSDFRNIDSSDIPPTLLKDSPSAPPLPLTLPPLEYEPMLRRPSVLKPIRVTVRPSEVRSPQSSPLSFPSNRSSPLTGPSLSQALHFASNKPYRCTTEL